MGAPQFGHGALISFVLKRSRIMKTGMIKPARRSGTPKIRPMLVPLLKVRLITKPAINRTSPTAILNEKP
jgi:hypothetical protein